MACYSLHIYVDFPEGRRQVSVLLLTWSHSGYRFGVALPSEQTEAILAGMVQGLEFFGCVPWEVWWDNPTTVATAVLEGRQRKVQPRYAALASHYCFDPRFCMPARGNEKPDVEHSVYDLQRDWATPVPRVQDLAELNVYLRSCALAKRDHTMAGKTQTIGELFEQDQQAGLLAASCGAVSSLADHRGALPIAFSVMIVIGWLWQLFSSSRQTQKRGHEKQTEVHE